MSAESKPFIISRDFDAPRELVWNAFGDPEHMRHWWGPKGFTVLSSKMDFRPGGFYHYGLRAPNGSPTQWQPDVGQDALPRNDPPNRIVLMNSFSDEAGGITRHPLHMSSPLTLQALRPTEEIDMTYIDGFVVPVPKRKLGAYRQMARKAGRLWLQHGALEFRESVADDVSWGKRTSFPRAVKRKDNETVVFPWIVFRSRKHRDAVNKKVMTDRRLSAMMKGEMPFDPKRMIYGGFKMIVSL